MPGKKKNAHEKLTIQEYQKLAEDRKKKRFRIQPYPWPVTLALLLPLWVVVLLLGIYFFHIRGVIG